MENKFELVFLIGAARSGTKMLRTLLEQSNSVAVIPYDINYIWKYGNYEIEHDELKNIEISKNTEKFIKNYIIKQQKKMKKPILVEKTVSNCLRVEYIKKIFPNAKIIHLYRDGRDVALSAKHRWEGSVFDKELQSKKDIVKKILDLPFFSVMPYLIKYIKINLKHTFSPKSSFVDSWGPIYKGMDIDKERLPILEVCALQWKKSVDSTLKSLENYVEGKDYINISYENLLSSPKDEICKLINFINIEDSKNLFQYSTNNIKSKNMNKWINLEKEELENIERLQKETLEKLGYKVK